MATDYQAILDLARLRLPGALDGVIQLELGILLSDFCDATNAWVEQVAFQTIPGQVAYEVYPVQGMPIRLMNVVDNLDPTIARPWDVYFVYPNILQFRTAPNVAQTFYANISLQPDDDFPGSVPTWFWSKYHSLLVDGILGRMMSQIAKPYSSPQNAKLHTMMFNSGAASARVEVIRRFRFRGQGWLFPQGWSTRKHALGGGATNIAAGTTTATDTTEVTTIQLKRRLNADGLLAAIAALIPADPTVETNIIWTGQLSHLQDNLARFIQTALGYSTTQMSVMYTSAAALSGALPPSTMSASAPAIYMVQLKRQLQFAGLLSTVDAVIPSAADNDVNVVWTGVCSTYGDSLSVFIQSTLGYSSAQMLALYTSAFAQERMVPSVASNNPDAATVFTEQLKRQLNIDGTFLTVSGAIPMDVTDNAYIAWNAGVTYYGDALSQLIQTTLSYNDSQMRNLYRAALVLVR